MKLEQSQGKTRRAFALLGLFFMLTALFAACVEQEPDRSPVYLDEDQVGSVSQAPDENGDFEAYGGQPNLCASADGMVYLSWIKYVDDSTDALLFSRLEEGNWSNAKEIARGSNWFVNWADFPTIAAHKNGKVLAVNWLQKSAEGTYDYDVMISTSIDGGENWSAPFKPHTDGIAAEHGFVSIQPLAKSKKFIACWLDGRHTKAEPAGQMSLRSVVFDTDGKLEQAIELDNSVCDCCQTDMALLPAGAIIAYRDRSAAEIRDISTVSFSADGLLSEPSTVHEDGWEIAGCPVNGPAIASWENQVAVAWYTEADPSKTSKLEADKSQTDAQTGKAQARLAFSKDAGKTFGPPIELSRYNTAAAEQIETLGRLDVLWLNETEVLVTSAIKLPEELNILIEQVDVFGVKRELHQLAVNSPERTIGFPKIVAAGNTLHLAWTATKGESSVVLTVHTDLDQFAVEEE